MIAKKLIMEKRVMYDHSVDQTGYKWSGKSTLKKIDIVICTALIPGKPAPRILTEDLVKLMKPGSIIYDLAAEQGGNSAFSESGKINSVDGIKIIGVKNLPPKLPSELIVKVDPFKSSTLIFLDLDRSASLEISSDISLIDILFADLIFGTIKPVGYCMIGKR